MIAWEVKTATPLPGYRLEVTFSDGLRGVVDLSDLPHEGVFAPWADHSYFSQVRVDPVTGTASWPNGADVAPDAMYEEVKRRQETAV